MHDGFEVGEGVAGCLDVFCVVEGFECVLFVEGAIGVPCLLLFFTSHCSSLLEG